MSGTSKTISALTTATVLDGSEIFPIVQSGETRRAAVSVLRLIAPVQSVNGLTDTVILGLSDFPDISAAIDDVSALTSANYAAIISVQTYLSALISVAASAAGLPEVTNDGQIYGRSFGVWVPVSVTALQTQIDAVSALVSTNAVNIAANTSNIAVVSALASRAFPYDISFDFGVSTVPQGEYAAVVTPRTFYVLPSCSNSQIAINTSAFPTAIVSIPVMFPTSTTLGILTIGVSGTAVWPAIATTSVSIGQTFGVQTSVSADANLKGLRITFAGYYRA